MKTHAGLSAAAPATHPTTGGAQELKSNSWTNFLLTSPWSTLRLLKFRLISQRLTFLICRSKSLVLENSAGRQWRRHLGLSHRPRLGHKTCDSLSGHKLWPKGPLLPTIALRFPPPQSPHSTPPPPLTDHFRSLLETSSYNTVTQRVSTMPYLSSAFTIIFPSIA